MNIRFAEEQEQLKEDGDKLKIDKNCYNCKDQALNRDDRKVCKIQVEIAVITKFRTPLSEMCCSLHERK